MARVVYVRPALAVFNLAGTPEIPTNINLEEV